MYLRIPRPAQVGDDRARLDRQGGDHVVRPLPGLAPEVREVEPADARTGKRGGEQRRGQHDGLSEAQPILLEPVMAVEVVTPERFVGAIQGDINARHGQILGAELRGETQVLQVEVPLSKMFGYVSDLRSMSQGRASYTMQFARYAQVSKEVAEMFGAA